MSPQQVISGWSKGADDALDTAQKLMDSGKYHHALFFCHLAIEKQLKAKCIQKTGEPALPIHGLVRLAQMAGVKSTYEQREQLREINTFNVEARYDDYKLRFYKKATKQYAQAWLSITKTLLLWLKQP